MLNCKFQKTSVLNELNSNLKIINGSDFEKIYWN